MKLESTICMLGYLWVSIAVLSEMEHFGPESWPYQLLAALGAMPLGYWCAHCDMREARR